MSEYPAVRGSVRGRGPGDNNNGVAGGRRFVLAAEGIQTPLRGDRATNLRVDSNRTEHNEIEADRAPGFEAGEHPTEQQEH